MNRVDSRWTVILVLAVLTIATYAPAMNNGFIADDFVFLHSVEAIKTNPHVLVETAPEVFRSTSNAAFVILKGIFGADYRPFYVFNILLHLANVILLTELVSEWFCDKFTGLVAGVLFAVFQAPQEAVMWIAAMHETLLGLFVLATLLLWMRRRHGWALITYSLALISKESAVVVLLLVPLIDRERSKHWIPERYFLLFIPTGIFALAFAYTASNNFMMNDGTYAVGLHAIPVFLRSMHRLLWPWGYGLFCLAFLANRRWPERRLVANCLVLMGATLVPYTFLTYARAIPSRQMYLASAMLASTLAAGIFTLSSRWLKVAYVSAFVVFNIGYIWLRKDAQMEERAAPTTALIQELKRDSPRHTIILNFPYPYPEIAKGAALLAPGWQWDQVELSQHATECTECLLLEWDPTRRQYRRLAPQ
jgi:hypothetical protein